MTKTTIAAALLLLGFGAAASVMAQDVTSTKPVTSSLLVALPDGSMFFVSPGPCVPAGENVLLTGNLHAVTLVRQGMLSEVHLNLAAVQGIGQTTGNLYVGTGAQKFSGLAAPVSSSDVALRFNPNFTLEHTDGCASDTLSVTVDLSFGADGTLARVGVLIGNGPALSGIEPDAALPEGGLRALALELPEAR